MYEKELLFFRTLGAPGGELSTIVGVPNCLGSWVDPVRDATQHLM